MLLLVKGEIINVHLQKFVDKTFVYIYNFDCLPVSFYMYGDTCWLPSYI